MKKFYGLSLIDELRKIQKDQEYQYGKREVEVLEMAIQELLRLDGLEDDELFRDPTSSIDR